MSKFSIKLSSPGQKFLLLVPALFILVAAVFVAKWSLGNLVATQVGNAKLPQEIAVEKELAQLATTLAPDDPQTFYSNGVVLEKSNNLEDVPQILQIYEKAVSLSPNDYRFWLVLGKAREHGGDAAGGEKAFQRALELAPNYAQVHWALGNLLLRQNRIEEGFQHLRTAAAANDSFAPSTVGLAWQFSDGDVPTITRQIGDSPTIRASLAVFLARQKRTEDALKTWNSISTEDAQTKFKDNGNELFNNLIANKNFRAALQVRQSILPSEMEKPEAGKLLNPSFEADNYYDKAGANFFGWQIAEAAQPAIGINDEAKQDGARSLVLVFSSPTGKDFRQVLQNVVVEPNTGYHLEFFAKTGNLKAKETLRWDIVDLNDEKNLAESAPVAIGENDWQKISVDFQTKSATEAVRLQLARMTCVSCGISGKIWFDNFALRKIGETKN